MELSFRRAGRVTGWLLAVIITILSLVPPDLRPATQTPHTMEHFIIFLVTGSTFAIGYVTNPVIVSAMLVLFAATIEVAQNLVPGRHARWTDFYIDATAMCIGLIVTRIIETQVARNQR